MSQVCSKEVLIPVPIREKALLTQLVNDILADHNVDKQITDNKGDVWSPCSVCNLY